MGGGKLFPQFEGGKSFSVLCLRREVVVCGSVPDPIGRRISGRHLLMSQQQQSGQNLSGHSFPWLFIPVYESRKNLIYLYLQQN